MVIGWAIKELLDAKLQTPYSGLNLEAVKLTLFTFPSS